MINLTPPRLMCSLGGCPAVYKQEDGTIVIIGKRNPKAAAELIKDGKVAPDEEVVFISPEFLKNIETTIPTEF